MMMIDLQERGHLKTENRDTNFLYLGCGLLTVIILMIDLAIPLGVAGGVPYITVVLLSLRSPQKKITIIVSIICSILTIVGFFFSPPGGEIVKVLSNRALALFAIWVTAALTLQRKIVEEEREKAIFEREKALEDTKILRGLLPTCASCKKIRDDNGHWNQIEVYIKQHSEANFSHGICPECARKLYPDVYKEEDVDSGT
jgi:hypothetical protein